jgi:phosphatidylglycerol:prolipoprotein diacylglycerol transferase
MIAAVHPILLDLGEAGGLPLRITSYGAAMLLAMVVGWLVVRRLGPRVDPDVPWTDLVLGLLIAGLLGAKLLHALIRLPDILAGRVTLVAVLLGGGVWLGGVAGAFGYAAWFFRRHRLEAGRALNVLFVAAPLGHAIGRVGCLLAGCCYGAACSLPWAITYHDPLAHELSGTPLGVPLHPTPLYESLAELFNFAVCLALWRRDPPPWAIPAAWLALYGAERFAFEFLRGDERGALGPLSTSQWLALAMIAAAALLWLTRLRPARAAAA